jgi:hypothetical protein
MSVTRRDVHWLADPEDQHVQAAEAFLTLVGLPDQARRLVAAMLAAPNIDYTAKDLIRATRLPLLEASDTHVSRDLQKIKDGAALSPLLLVRGDICRDLPLTIADGYHRLCAAFHADQDADVACRIADSPT